MMGEKNKKYKKNGRTALDYILFFIMILLAVQIVVPLIHVIAISFSTQKEYLDTPLLLVPTKPTLDAYRALFADGRIWIGYKSTLTLVGLGVPVNMLLTTTIAYALSRGNFPGRRPLMYMIVFTMLFQGGIIPLYLIMKSYNLIDSIWSCVLATGINTFYMILMMNYFSGIPAGLIESARIEGAGEWRVLFQIVIPLSLPIIATVGLYYISDRWNEWYNPMIFINSTSKTVLQLVLRNIVNDTKQAEDFVYEGMKELPFTSGVKMAAVVMTMLPVMCVFPFLQKYFIKGMRVGAIKG